MIVKPGNQFKVERKKYRASSKNQIWKTVSHSGVLDDANSLLGCFNLAIRDDVTEKKIGKAKVVFQGHRDKMKSSVVFDTSVTRQCSIKMLARRETMFELRLSSINVAKAYIQSSE